VANQQADQKAGAEDVGELVRDIGTMLVEYVKQETLEPIKGLARFVAVGLAAMVVTGIGIVLLLLGGVRLLQDEAGSAFDGHLKFLPYVFALIVCAVVAAGALRAASGPSRKAGSVPERRGGK
jgi:hypothetical protein